MNFFELSIDHLGEIEKLFTLDGLALENYFLNPEEERFKMYGYVSGNFLSIVSSIDSISIPAWSLSRSYSYGSIENQFVILQDIISLKEKQSLYQFFTLINDIEFQFLQSNLDRYQPYLEHIVPPNSLTGYESIDHDIMEYKIYDDSLKIFNWVLKNEYRIIEK